MQGLSRSAFRSHPGVAKTLSDGWGPTGPAKFCRAHWPLLDGPEKAAPGHRVKAPTSPQESQGRRGPREERAEAPRQAPRGRGEGGVRSRPHPTAAHSLRVGGGGPPSAPRPSGCCKATRVCASKATGMHAHTGTHTAVHTHTSMSTHAQHVDACTLKHTHTRANTLPYWLTYTPAHTCSHAHTHPCAHTRVCNHTKSMSLVMHPCLHTSTRVHIHLHMYIHSHMHTYTRRDIPTHGRYLLTLAHSHKQHTHTRPCIHAPTHAPSHNTHTCTHVQPTPSSDTTPTPRAGLPRTTGHRSLRPRTVS